jgi:FKBP-type peptidyl-prolyl cis-trans isomerase FkpA
MKKFLAATVVAMTLVGCSSAPAVKETPAEPTPVAKAEAPAAVTTTAAVASSPTASAVADTNTAAVASSPTAAAVADTNTAATASTITAATALSGTAVAISPTAEPAEASSVMGGLRIKDVVIGTGAEAVAGSTVSVNYTGRLLTGKQFDTSIGRGPFSFRLGAGQVIKGWDQGVAGMKVGGKRTLTIPPDLGYGSAGAGDAIPPDATLVFDVELLDVK